MKIEPVACIWMFVCDEFWAARNGKNQVFGFSGQTCVN